MNKRLLMLSGLAILAVVMNHASHAGFLAMFWWTDQYRPVTVPNFDQIGSLSYYGLVAAQKLALFSVPSFLFITGMFLSYTARGGQSHLTWPVIFRRIQNLLPPYIFWTAIYFLAEFLFIERAVPLYYLLGFVSISYSPFFFVPMVIVYYLLSPLLVPIAKQRPWLMLACGALPLLIGIASGYLHQYIKLNGIEGTFFSTPASYLVERQVLEYFFYYAAGLTAGFYQSQLKAFIVRYRWPLLGTALVAGALAVGEAEWLFQASGRVTDWRSRTLTLPTAIYAITFILSFLAFDQVRLPAFLYQLGVNTLGIYLIHRSVLMILPKIIYHVLPFVLGIQAIYQLLLVSIAIGTPLLLMFLTRQLPLKNHFRLLFG